MYLAFHLEWEWHIEVPAHYHVHIAVHLSESQEVFHILGVDNIRNGEMYVRYIIKSVSIVEHAQCKPTCMDPRGIVFI